MDNVFGTASLQLMKPATATSPKHQRDVISIRSLSYQKNVNENKLKEDCKN